MSAPISVPTDIQHLIAANHLDTLQEIRGGLEHQLRSPLHTVVLNVALLEELVRSGGGTTAEVQLERLGAISESMRRFQAGFVRLLREIEVVAGDPATLRQPVDLNELCAEVGELVGAELRQRGLRLELAPSEGSTSILVRRGEVRQALLNLLVNAVLASPAAGRIGLAVTQPEPGAGLRIEVRDEGAGLDEAIRDSLFEAHTSTWGRAGLGLFVARRLVDAEGGRLSWATRGPGTSFFIEFPEVTA